MPLPILLWIAAAGIVGAVGAALAKDDSESVAGSTANRRSNSDEDDNEDELEQREEKARNKKITNARGNFRKEGSERGLDIQKSIKGWIDIEFIEEPFFKLKLGKDMFPHASVVNATMSFFGKELAKDMPTQKLAVIERLSVFEKKIGFKKGCLQDRFEVFLSAYAAELKLGKQFFQAEKKIDALDLDIKKIQELKKLIASAKQSG